VLLSLNANQGETVMVGASLFVIDKDAKSDLKVVEKVVKVLPSANVKKESIVTKGYKPMIKFVGPRNFGLSSPVKAKVEHMVESSKPKAVVVKEPTRVGKITFYDEINLPLRFRKKTFSTSEISLIEVYY
jgi:hypothetical protein